MAKLTGVAERLRCDNCDATAIAVVSGNVTNLGTWGSPDFESLDAAVAAGWTVYASAPRASGARVEAYLCPACRSLQQPEREKLLGKRIRGTWTLTENATTQGATGAS